MTQLYPPQNQEREGGEETDESEECECGIAVPGQNGDKKGMKNFGQRNFNEFNKVRNGTHPRNYFRLA